MIGKASDRPTVRPTHGPAARWAERPTHKLKNQRPTDQRNDRHRDTPTSVHQTSSWTNGKNKGEELFYRFESAHVSRGARNFGSPQACRQHLRSPIACPCKASQRSQVRLAQKQLPPQLWHEIKLLIKGGMIGKNKAHRSNFRDYHPDDWDFNKNQQKR